MEDPNLVNKSTLRTGHAGSLARGLMKTGLQLGDRGPKKCAPNHNKLKRDMNDTDHQMGMYASK